MLYHGVGACTGIGIGRVVYIREQNLDYSGVVYAGKTAEKARLQKAVKLFCEKTQQMANDIRQRAGEKESEILTGQIMMLNDPFMLSQIDDHIDNGQPAEQALDEVCETYAAMFAGVDDEMMRQRATDVRDIRTRMLTILLGADTVDLAALPAGSVLLARDLTPSMTVGLHPENVSALLTEVGGKTSHSAILARALGIPAVLGIAHITEQIQEGDHVIVDGREGLVIASPDERTLAEYTRRQAEDQKRQQELAPYRHGPTLNADGKAYQLYANIGSFVEAQAACKMGAEGIGLFRTEFLFMNRTAMPTEAEQYDVYHEIASLMPDKDIIIRTLDVGGDKAIPYLHMPKEDNPFLGYRAIRYSLDQPEVFRIQLRALLRAGADHHNIKIMLPLVTGVEEVRSAKTLLQECKIQLRREGLPCDENIALGVMIETPAAAVMADLLAKEADFFSIGTNDLTQYTLAVDRGNAKVESLYTPFHPAVLRSIRGIIAAAHEAGIPVGMCGEAAADPCMIPLLLSFGLDEFSVSAAAVPAVRKAIASWRETAARHTAEDALRLSDAAGILGYLKAVCSG